MQPIQTSEMNLLTHGMLAAPDKIFEVDPLTWRELTMIDTASVGATAVIIEEIMSSITYFGICEDGETLLLSGIPDLNKIAALDLPAHTRISNLSTQIEGIPEHCKEGIIGRIRITFNHNNPHATKGLIRIWEGIFERLLECLRFGKSYEMTVNRDDTRDTLVGGAIEVTALETETFNVQNVDLSHYHFYDPGIFMMTPDAMARRADLRTKGERGL